MESVEELLEKAALLERRAATSDPASRVVLLQMAQQCREEAEKLRQRFNPVQAR